MGALSHARPLLVLPQPADGFANAERIVAAGAGLTLRRDQRSAPRCATPFRAGLLDDPRERRAAATIAAKIAAMPEPRDPIPALQALRRTDH